MTPTLQLRTIAPRHHAARPPRRGRGHRPERRFGLLLIAPYNAQVFELQALLPGARVGTVDKFQGQEAPVTLYSMASSSADHAPRGLDFLYQRNRLNVATSRARCLTIIVANPDLVRVLCGTPQQMILANGLCSATERAGLRP